MEENFLLDLVSALDQGRSQKQVNADIKQLQKTINMLQLTATLAKGNSKKEINAYIKTLSDQLSTIKLKAKIDSKNLKSEINSALNKVSFKEIDVLNIDGNKTKLKVQKVIADARAYAEKNPISIGINYENRRNKLDNDLTSYLNRNTKISESSVLLKEADKVRNLIGAINDKKSLREATDAFQLYKSEVSATGFASKSTADRIKSMFGHITKLGGLFSVTSLVVNNFTKSLGTLKDIDDILTEISKTSDLTAQELERLGDISFKSASKYGKTASDYLTGIQEMSRSGFYGDKGIAMAEQSLLAQAAGDISADLANNYILATNAAYKLNGEADKLNAVLDGQNSITNRNSVALSDMAIAMSEAGTVASSYRVSIEDLSAMIGTMEAVTKLGGSEVGNGIKAILINLQNVTSSKITDTLDAANASMTEFVNGTEKLRDPISILRDLAETFNKLDEDDALRAEILTNIGGKHQAAKLAALLQNMELFDKMLVDYSEGSGSAMEEAMKSANNLSGKLNQLQNSWDSLVNSIVNKNSVLSGLTFGDKLIQSAESFIDTFGEIPVLLTTINTAMAAMKKDYGITQLVNPETKKLDVQGNIFGIDISKIKNLKKHYKDAGEAILQWNDKLSNGKADIESFNTALVQNSASFKEYLSTCSKDAPASLKGYKDYLQATGQATEDLRLQTILLNTALTFLGSIAVQAVITGIANAFDKFNETVVESKEKVDDINSKISDLKTQLEELNGLEYKSDFDKQKISQLERELELQEKILEIEQKRLYQNQIGTKFSDYFDGDSLIAKQQTENDRNNQDRLSNLSRWSRVYESSLNDIDAELTSLQEKLNSEDLIGRDRFMTEGRITELTEKRNDLLEKQQTIEDQLTVNMGEYLKNYQTAQEAVDSGLLTGSDLEKAESMAAYWNQMYQDSTDIVTNIQKMNGIYDDTVDKLEEKFNGISRNDLALLSDDDKRIALSFSSDNIIGFEELQQKIAETKGDVVELNGTEINLFNQLAGSEEELDTFQSSVKSATEAYSTLLSGNYSSTELLDSIQAINKAVSDMGGSLNWEFINSQKDSLDLLGDAIQHISQKYAESILSGAGIDIDSEFGQMLANIIQQIYDTEAAFEGMNSQLDNLQSSYHTLTEVLESYNETGYISLDNLQSLLTADENLIAMLQVENGQLVLNQAAYENLVAVQLLEFKAKLNDAAAAEIETLAKQKAEQATNQNADASQNAVAKLDAETQAFNRNTSAAIANAVAKAEESGVSAEEIQGVFDKYTEVWNSAMDNYNVDFDSFMSGAKSAASKAGKEHADEYIKAFEKEYSNLKDMLDRGEISEAQYLNRLRVLYNKYFRDRKKYLNEYKKYESEYLTGMLDLHNKALSGISTLLNRKISAANDAKDASISALQEEKEAAEEAYRAQIDAIEKEKDAIDDLIKEKNKKIASLNEEIDAIERAAETRKKNIQLEKDQYNLEKMLNNRSSMVYKDGQFVWDTDTRGIRDAREKVREDQEALRIDGLKNEISLIQKEIDLLEEKKDSLSDEQDRIQKLMDESNKYYDNLIKQQEKMWDSIIKGMEQNKSRWEELAEVEEIAKAFSYIQQVFGDLGYTVEDVLNGSDAAFEDFKSRYISLISDVNNNSDFTKGLVYATGVAKENLGSFLDKTKETGAGIDDLSSKGSELDSVAEGMDGIATSASTADTNLSNAAASVGDVATNVSTLNDNLSQVNGLITEEQASFNNLKEKIDEVITKIKEKTSAIQEEQQIVGGAVSSEMADFLLLKGKIDEVQQSIGSIGDTINQLDSSAILKLLDAFQLLYNKLVLISITLGAGMEGAEEGAVGGIASAIQALNEISLAEGIIAQFTNLKTAIDEVTSAISGGGGGDSEGSAGGEGSGGSGGKTGGVQSGGKGSKGEGSGGGDSLTGAIETMGETAKEVIGEPDAEGDGTVIGEFGALETAVTDVTSAIGGGESEGGEGQGKGSGGEGESGEGNLISSIKNLGETTEETLGEPGGDGVIGRFEQFEQPIQEADEHVHSISDGLAAIDGQEVECTIKIHIESDGFPSYASGTALGAMNLNSAEYNAKYTGNAHVAGTANVTGNWGVSKPGKSLVGEIGQELWVHSANGTFETVGDNGPEWIRTEKGDLIFNHLQTKELLDKGNIVKTGKAYANGTIEYSDGTIIQPNGEALYPLQPWDRAYDLMQKFDTYFKSIDGNLDILTVNARARYEKQMDELAKQVTNVSNVTNNRNVQQPVYQTFNITMPNVNDSTSAAELMNDLQSISRKKFQVNW